MWPVMPLKTVLVPVVHAAAPGQDKAWRSMSVLWPDILVMSLGFAASGRRADVSGMCDHLRPYQST